MTYIDGFVAAVPKANKEAYSEMARQAATMFLEWGATRVVENWEDDVADGKVTDFRRAVAAKADEAIVFSWIEYPDKATRDVVQKKMMEDPEMGAMQMPFDMGRLIYGGFETLFIA
ncbi:DUF1428 domain-containing protein [Devosia beringensis]|uniref:DUF1428 domain-containing protein n=1 Tax=Devosia beringensis TaxID=2657486 RepID=UPI00186B75AE|nr:DUF1428 domain-containing protein [Devosia beringensis]